MRPTVTIRTEDGREFTIDAAQEVPEKWTPFTVVDGTQVSEPVEAEDSDEFDSAEDFDEFQADGGRTPDADEEDEIDELLAEAAEAAEEADVEEDE